MRDKANCYKTHWFAIAVDLNELDLNHEDTINFQFPSTPFWSLNPVEVNLELTKLQKSITSPQKYKIEYYKLISTKYYNHEKIFTDGSKSDLVVGCAAVPVPQDLDEMAMRLPDDASIFTAEASALDMALSTICKSSKPAFVILSDSLSSCLQALQAHETLDPRILKLKIKYNSLTLKGKSIAFAWIPSHVGIDGNDMADGLAKESLSAEISQNIKLPYQDFKQKIRFLIFSKWETSNQIHNKLQNIKTKLKRGNN